MNDRITKMRNLLNKWKKEKFRYEGSRRVFDDEFKQLLIQYHYESNKTISELANEFGLDYAQIAYWKKQFGYEPQGFYVGERVLNDVRSRCLAVKEYVENNKEPDELATKYGVRSKYTIIKWVEKYLHTYQHFIDTLPDGVPWLANEERQVFGSERMRLHHQV